MSARRQIGRFLVVGVVATLSDAVVYAALQAAGFTPDPAKALSFVVGTGVAWVLNRRWTFEAADAGAADAARFFVLYAASFALNVGVHHLLHGPAVDLFGPPGATVAFVGATATSTVSNFFGQRLWVFRRHISPSG